MLNRKYIEYLAFLHLDAKQEKHTPQYSAAKTTAELPYCNRAVVHTLPTADVINELTNYYSSTPYTIWVDAATSFHTKIDHPEWEFQCTYPLMTADLNKIASCSTDEAIRISKLNTPDEIYSIWLPLLAKIYNTSADEFRKFVDHLLATLTFACVHFYVGYFEDKPAAISLFILREDTVDVHWVGTLPEYRYRGLGFDVTAFPLHVVKEKVSRATLYTSPMAKSLYEKIGFVEVGGAHVFKVKPSEKKA